MNKISTIIMYLLWIFAIIALLATTFTNFQYIDLNAIAGVLLLFALVNSFFITSRTDKNL